MAIKDMHKVIDAIVGVLFAADDRRLTGWVDRLCLKNQEARRIQDHGFLYAGVFYRPSNVQGFIASKRSLEPSLFPQMDDFLKDKSSVDTDKAFIRQALFLILEPCKTLQDVRDTLPECIVDCVSQVRGLPRGREPAFTIQDNPRATRQFQKILPKIEVYSAARLIY